MKPKNKVERAIIMAAGKGKRMHPLTDTVPKPLIKVNGVCMICSVIDSLHANKIYEIYIVVGYLKEKFEFLTDIYPDIKLIENPYYQNCNNISSLYVARDYIKNCFIIDGDQIIKNPEVFNPYFNHSGYNAVWCDGYTSEWIMETDQNIVTNCNCEGGEKGWQLFSISRWSAEDGEKLSYQIQKEFENGNTDIYWDNVAMDINFDSYILEIYKMNNNDVIEIDCLDELKMIDKKYLDI